MMNIQKMMKQAQKMQSQMNKAQEDLKNAVFTGEAGGDLVTLEINGQHDLQKITIKPEVVDPEDIEALEDLITAAYQNAKQKLDQESQEKMGGITGGMNLPGF